MQIKIYYYGYKVYQTGRTLNVELHQMRYFQCVARYESVSKAADELHVSQSALSKSISKLENELGVKLFDRRGKRISINENGLRFQQDVVRILDDIDSSIESLQGYSQQEQ